MDFLKWIITIIFVLALIAGLIVYPFVYVADKMFLSEDYYTETLDEMGVYDKAYNIFLTIIDKTVEEKGFKEGAPKDSADWIIENVKIVLSREYMKDLMKITTADMVLYIKGDLDEMPTFDLMPKYDELRELTESQLDAEKVLSLMQVSEQGMPLDFLAFLGIIDKEGEINTVLKEELMKLVFENNQTIKDPFTIKSPVEALEFTGMEDPQIRIDALRERIIFFHRSIMVLLMFISFLTAFIILVWIRKARIGFAVNGSAYIISASLCLVISTGMSSGNEMVMKIVNERLNLISNKLFSILNLREIIVLFGKEVIPKSLILAGIAIMFFILTGIFNRRYRKRLEARHL